MCFIKMKLGIEEQHNGIFNTFIGDGEGKVVDMIQKVRKEEKGGEKEKKGEEIY